MSWHPHAVASWRLGGVVRLRHRRIVAAWNGIVTPSHHGDIVVKRHPAANMIRYMEIRYTETTARYGRSSPALMTIAF